MYILMIPSSLRCIFFFYCYATHRDLHSFPTRRSSDLADRDLAVAAQGHVAVPAYTENCRAMNSRSEEHTSELQSRLHLVCRLLLEKKNVHECNAQLIDEPDGARRALSIDAVDGQQCGE